MEGLTEQELRAAVTAVRSAYAEAGSPRGQACRSASCLRLATRRVFWPVQPGEDYPAYCDACAAWARKVLEAMGVAYRDEALPDLRTCGERRRALRLPGAP